MWGNIAPDGCVVKRSAVAPEMQEHSGPARVFNSEETAIAAIYAGKIVPGDVVVIRYEGPKGGPGMREMLNPTSALAGMKLDKTVASSPMAASPAQARCSHWPCQPGGCFRRPHRPDRGGRYHQH